MRKLTLDETIRVAEEVVSGKEDFVYNPSGAFRCYYLPLEDTEEEDPRGASGCLVGEIMMKLNVPKEELDIQASSWSLLPLLEDKKILSFDQMSWDFLSRIQTYQDGGKPWGIALNIAKNYIENVKAEANG